jgi:membrane associated rhomboid family serine protease
MFVVPVEVDNPTRHVHFVLWTIVALNVATFAVSRVFFDYPQVLREYGLVPIEVSALTFLTSAFLHGGFIHLLGNMFFLWMFGDNVEDIVGPLLFLTSYAVCGAAASLAYLPLHPDSTVPLVGASGAISGIVGMYLFFFPRADAELCVYLFRWEVATFRVSILAAILVWFGEQVALAAIAEMTTLGQVVRVAFSAHVGGFLAGCAIGWVFVRMGFVRRYVSNGARHPLLGYVT